MDKEKLLAIFKDEVKEHIGKLSEGLLLLEKEPLNEAVLKELFRRAHTLKGASKMMGYESLSSVSHDMESTFEAIKEKRLAVDSALIDNLLKSADSLRALMDEILQAGGKLEKAKGKPLSAEEALRVPAGLSDELLGLSTQVVQDAVLREQRKSRLKAFASGIDDLEARLEGLIDEFRRVDEFRKVAQFEKFTDLLNAPLTDAKKLKTEFIGIWKDAADDASRTFSVASQLRDKVSQMRLSPLSIVTDGLSRCVRDLARAQQKEIEFVVEGQNTALDRMIINEIKDPMMHVVRNCVDHGIEPPRERERIGKPHCGQIRISAYQKKEKICIEIFDDGKGLVPGELMEAAVRKKFLTEDEAGKLPAADIINIIFASGFSTAPIITDISGRGVGLDVVKTNIEKLRGKIYVDSQPGKFTRFTLELPLTLAVFDALLFEVSESLFAIDVANIDSTMEAYDGKEQCPDIKKVWLADILEIARLKHQADGGSKLPAVVLRSPGGGRVGYIVDRVLAQQRIFLQGSGPYLGKIKNVAGFSVLESGEIAIVLEPAELLESSKGLHPIRWIERKPISGKRRILIVEDSYSMREMERAILFEHGFEVEAAIDAESALSMLAKDNYELLVIDMRLPGMDGFEFLKTVRQNASYRGIPVVIVSSLEKEEDVRRGIELGAGAYITKRAFEENKFLDIVERLLV